MRLRRPRGKTPTRGDIDKRRGVRVCRGYVSSWIPKYSNRMRTSRQIKDAPHNKTDKSKWRDMMYACVTTTACAISWVAMGDVDAPDRGGAVES